MLFESAIHRLNQICNRTRFLLHRLLLRLLSLCLCLLFGHLWWLLLAAPAFEEIYVSTDIVSELHLTRGYNEGVGMANGGRGGRWEDGTARHGK